MWILEFVIWSLIAVITLPFVLFVATYVIRRGWLQAEVDFFDASVKEEHQDKEICNVECKRTFGEEEGFGKEVR